MKTLAIPIEDELDEALDAVSARVGRDKAQVAGEMLRRCLQEQTQGLPADEGLYHPKARPIEEILANLAREVPEEEWARLPRDLTDQLDHYLYGAPRR